MNVLVTGGCGYIGSHMVKMLLREGHMVTVLDCAAGDVVFPDDVFVRIRDVGDEFLSDQLIGHEIEAVIHFAASSIVVDSIRDPAKYFQNNVASGINFLKSCLDAGVKKFIFSSSAAVYGNTPTYMKNSENKITESCPLEPLSPYGESKLMFENILRRYSDAYGLRSVSLRYFNAAGAADGLQERHEPETHLIPLAIDAALGGKPLTIFGTDYPTPDGTAVRDYVHVTDLCEGHLKALEYLEAGGATDVFNLGSGLGTSVRQIIRRVEALTNRHLEIVESPRRPGDPPALVADITKAREILKWVPCHDRIVGDALASRR